MKKIPAPNPKTSLENPSAAFICNAAKPRLSRSRYATRYSSATKGMSLRRTRRIAGCTSDLRGAAPFPSGFEQLQSAAGPRMGAACLVIEHHAQSRTLRQIETAVALRHERRMIDEILHPGIGKVVEVFEQFVIGRGHGEVDVRERADRSADVVWREQQAMRVRPAREALHRKKAAEVREIRLNDVGDAALDELSNIGDGVRAFAGRHRNARRTPHAIERIRVLGRHRLLEPLRIVRFEQSGHAYGRCGCESAVHLDHNLDVRSDSIAYGRHDRLRAAAFARRQLRAGGAKGIELERAIPALDDRARELPNRPWIACRLVPAVRIRRNAIAKSTAKQLPNRDAERLPHQIPTGNVDRGERRLRDFAGPAVLGALHVPGEPFDVKWIRADDVPRSELIDARDERFRLVHHPHLTEAGQPGIGEELEKDELPPWRSDDRHARGRDLHKRQDLASQSLIGWPLSSKGFTVPRRLKRERYPRTL